MMMFEVRTVADGVTAARVVARYKKLSAAKAEARSLSATHGDDYEVFEVRIRKAYSTEADPACARFSLEDTLLKARRLK